MDRRAQARTTRAHYRTPSQKVGVLLGALPYTIPPPHPGKHCPAKLNDVASSTAPTDPVAGGYTFHTLGTIIAGSAAAFAVLSTLLLMLRHATHLSRPAEQLKILRICLLIPVASVVQLVGQAAPAAYFYILPWADMMQALALANFFLLLLELLGPRGGDGGGAAAARGRELFFGGLRVPARRKGGSPRDGLRWYRRKWVAVFQYPVVQLVVSVATDATQAPSVNIYCQNSNKPYFAHLWVSASSLPPPPAPSLSPRCCLWRCEMDRLPGDASRRVGC